MLLITGCSSGDDAHSTSSTADPSSRDDAAPPTISDMQRRLLDEADGAGAPDRVVAASADEALCAAFDIAVRTAQELSTAKDADLQELLTSAQAPMKDIATRLEAAGLWRTARFWNSYH